MGMIIIAVVVAATMSPSVVVTGPIIRSMPRATGVKPQPAASMVVSGWIVGTVSWSTSAELAAVRIIIVFVVIVTTSPAPVIVTRRIISTVLRTTGAEPPASMVVTRARSRRSLDGDAIGRAGVVGAVPGADLGEEEGEGEDGGDGGPHGC
ncbi:hypothetical protein KVR01_007942 [Diaporthe batatas]|uniref:uncharacterized protein n=1 Tax=Diaporthe batatas TaxID=748121 RepID=UPI001D0521F2|nr:uncharacterized protein KVR01_007942 [Diaporthe batatas]KAG8162177.1 hypothetical protein KVR01_007942 [Diaporthe batatas]